MWKFFRPLLSRSDRLLAKVLILTVQGVTKIYTYFNSGYLRTSPLWNQSVSYITWLTSIHGRVQIAQSLALPVDQSGVGAFDVQVLQYNFEVVLEILRVCAKTKGSGSVSSTEPRQHVINNWTHSRRLWDRNYGARFAQATIWEALEINQSCLFCCGGAAIHTNGDGGKHGPSTHVGWRSPLLVSRIQECLGVTNPSFCVHEISTCN
jgi:hypothetical protein